MSPKLKNMGAILKFIIFVFGIFFVLSLLVGASTMHKIIQLIFRGRRKSQNQSQQKNDKPITQDDRIITYKKKEFETSAAEDIDFEEIKDDKKR